MWTMENVRSIADRESEEGLRNSKLAAERKKETTNKCGKQVENTFVRLSADGILITVKKIWT